MKIQSLLAEFLGTFFLCYAGIAAILSATPAVGSGAGIVGIALAHGLALSPPVAVKSVWRPDDGDLSVTLQLWTRAGRAVKIGGFGIGLTVAFNILAGAR